MSEYVRQATLECVVLAALLIIGTDASAVRIATLVLFFVPACVAAGMVYGWLMDRFVGQICPGCGKRHAPEGGGGEG